jgi:cytochrome b561
MGYGTVARIFHWLTVLLVAVTIPVGFLMTSDLQNRSVQDTLFILHKGLGPVIFVVVVLRILWRVRHGSPELPASLPKYQQIVSKIVHAGLYAGLLTMAVSGYVRVIAGGFPIELLNAIGVPPLLPKNDGIAETAKAIHRTAVWGLLGLSTLHIGAALYHRFVRRDEIMARMWPPLGGSQRS